MKLLSIILFTLVMAFGALNAENLDKNETKFVLNTPNQGEIVIKEVENGVTFDKLKDKVVALVFIAYNGTPCLNLIEILKKMKKKHSDFDAFAVEMRGLSGDKLKEFVKQKEITFPIIGYENAKEFTNYIAQNTGWSGAMPFILIIDKKGVVRYIQVGLVPLEGFEKAYEELK
jgi:peroxiredoxin